jgi:hypothetical protein
VFRDADLHGSRFERGDLVRVAAAVERFREELQAELGAVARAAPEEADPAAFLPVALRDLDELDGFLEHLAGEVRERSFAALLDRLLGDAAMRAALRRTPCTRAGHHAYLGGLLEHTVAVGTLAVEACALHPRLDQDLLLTAALVHDLGRTREFALGAEIGLTRRAGCWATSSSACACWPTPHGRPGWTTRGTWRWPTACSRTTGRRTCRAGASARSRRSRCTASTPSTRPSRAHSSTARRRSASRFRSAPATAAGAARPRSRAAASRA